MNRLLMLLLMVFPGIALHAQTTPEAFLANVPSLPTSICSMKAAEKKAFLENNNAFSNKLEAEIERRKEASEELMDKNSDAIKTGTMKQAGFSPEDAKKMENMTEAEQMAMADKMMKQNYNISMAEAQNLKTMSKEQREAWARTHSAQMMADAQANPAKYQAKSNNAMEMIEINKQITALNQSFTDKNKEFQVRFATLENDPEGIKIQKDIQAKESILTSMMGEVSATEAAKMDKLSAEVKSLKDQYCSKFSPQYLAIINDYLEYIKKTMPDYYKFEELHEKQFRLQTGNQSPMGEKGLFGIQAIQGYSNILKDIFKYDLRNGAESQ